MKTLSKDGKCELVQKEVLTIDVCDGCFYSKPPSPCAANDSDAVVCTTKDLNNEGTYIFKEIVKCQNTTA